MTDVDLRLLVPRDIVLVTEDEQRVPIPGEVSVKRAMEIERIRGDLWAAGRERELAVDREGEAAARERIAKAYQEGADAIHALALERNPEAEPLDLTATMIEAVLSMLVAPAERETLMALAYSMALGLEVPDLDPLAHGSATSSSGSGKRAGSKARTGARSRGANSSRSTETPAEKR